MPAGSRFALEQYKGLADKKLKERKVNMKAVQATQLQAWSCSFRLQEHAVRVRGAHLPSSGTSCKSKGAAAAD